MTPHWVSNGSEGCPAFPYVENRSAKSPSEPAFFPESPAPGLIARDRELAHLEQILWSARAGRAGAVVFRGDPGVGKSTLIQTAIARASDFKVVHLRAKTLDKQQTSPSEWPAALIKSLSVPSPSDRTGGLCSLTGSSALPERLEQILSASMSPVLIAVDDCELFPDDLSAVLASAVFGPLNHTPTALVLAVEDRPCLPSRDLHEAGIPEHYLGGLGLEQSARLVKAIANDPSSEVLRTLVEATGGNPHALLDACYTLTPDQLSGWRPLPEPITFSDSLVRRFSAVLADLPEETRKALAIAAAGHAPVDLLNVALSILGLPEPAFNPAQLRGVVKIRGRRLDFQHQLVRAAAYQLAPADERAAVHSALARAFMQRGLASRAALHSSQSSTAPDDTVTRQWGQAARVALDNKQPEEAARAQELAAEFATRDDATAHHLAQAATLWSNTGRFGRALSCLEHAATQSDLTGFVQGEVLYQRAVARRKAGVQEDIASEMIKAAALCEPERPELAASILADAVAYNLLLSTDEEVLPLARRATALASVVSSQMEALARALQASVGAREGGDQEGSVWRWASRLVGQTEYWAAPASVAFVIGISLLQEGSPELVSRWATWVARCAESVGDMELAVVPFVLRATVELGLGKLERAIRTAEGAWARATRCQDHAMAARALGILVEAHAARGACTAGFEWAARLFSLSVNIGPAPTVQALLALALLELQRGRTTPALAWLRAAEETLLGEGGRRAKGRNPVLIWHAPTLATLFLLVRQTAGLKPLTEELEEAAPVRTLHRAWLPWLRAVSTQDMARATPEFDRALTALKDLPLAQARVELSYGVQLAEEGEVDGARPHLERAADISILLHADGWLELARRELERLPQRTNRQNLAKIATSRPISPVGSDSPATWEISLLGTFDIRRDGKGVLLPPGHAAQAVKIVALRRRLSVDELVELLWPEAEPGVGNRRFRNILWRVKSACGDLVQREGPLMSLGKHVSTDVFVFKRLADDVLHRSCPRDIAVERAHTALELYRGELLPGDRYADWAAPARESLSRLHARLLEMLLNHAIATNQVSEALGLIDQLIDKDPFDERLYLSAAELHANARNRASALSMLTRAERMLGELGAAPSPQLRELRGSLSRD